MSTAIIIGVAILIAILALGIFAARAMRRDEDKQSRPDGSGAGPDGGDGGDGGGD